MLSKIAMMSSSKPSCCILLAILLVTSEAASVALRSSTDVLALDSSKAPVEVPLAKNEYHLKIETPGSTLTLSYGCTDNCNFKVSDPEINLIKNDRGSEDSVREVTTTDSPIEEFVSGESTLLKILSSCPSGYERFEGYCYGIFPKTSKKSFSITQVEGKEECEKHNGQLASIHSQAENDFITQLARQESGFERFRIGLVRSGDGFGWIDGTPFDYQNWDHDEPNNLGKIEFGAEIYGSGKLLSERQGKWNDIGFWDPFEKVFKVVCKKPF